MIYTIIMSKHSNGVKQWRKRTKERIIHAMGGQCACCGYNRCPSALALHHIIPEQKDPSVAGWRSNSASWDKIVNELKKCILVCHNCHHEIHDDYINVPTNAPQFDEKYANYKQLTAAINAKIESETKSKPKIHKPIQERFHPCPRCNTPTPAHKKHCSLQCSRHSFTTRFRRIVNWCDFDLETLYKQMPVVNIAELIGCSDAAVHKRLKKLKLK
jgi:hypothetical protein